jgi:hypothetical protein
MFRLVMIMVLVILMGACAQVHTQVARFHHMPPVGSGETFAVVPLKNQAGSLEWERYADLVARQLTSKGYVRVAEPIRAKYAVIFSYAIDGGKTTTTEEPVFGQTGGGMTMFSGDSSGMLGGTLYSGFTSGTAYTLPTYGQIGSVPVTTTTYTRAVVIDIVDVPQSSASGRLVKTFEATARSSGSSGALAAVMPQMLAAIFKDFPGKSGEALSVSLPLER